MQKAVFISNYLVATSPFVYEMPANLYYNMIFKNYFISSFFLIASLITWANI